MGQAKLKGISGAHLIKHLLIAGPNSISDTLQLDQVFQSYVQLSFEFIQGWSFHNFSGKHDPMYDCDFFFLIFNQNFPFVASWVHCLSSFHWAHPRRDHFTHICIECVNWFWSYSSEVQNPHPPFVCSIRANDPCNCFDSLFAHLTKFIYLCGNLIWIS